MVRVNFDLLALRVFFQVIKAIAATAPDRHYLLRNTVIYHQTTPASASCDKWVVLVHGLTCTHSDWHTTVAALDNKTHCLTVDLRAHGASASHPGPYTITAMAQDVIEVMNHHEISNAVLVGHSMGTRVITSIYDQCPEQVRALVFVDGSLQGTGDPEQARRTILQLAGDDRQLPHFIESMFAMMFTADSPEKNAIVERARQTPAAVFRELIGNLMAFDAAHLKPLLATINIPLTVIQSTVVDADRKRRPLQPGQTTDYTDTVKHLVPHAGIVIIEGIGHFTQLDATQQVADAIAGLSNHAH